MAKPRHQRKLEAPDLNRNLAALIAAVGAQPMTTRAIAVAGGYEPVSAYAEGLGMSCDGAQRWINRALKADALERVRVSNGTGGTSYWYRAKR